MKICFIGWGRHVHLERWAGYFALTGHEVSVISVDRPGSYPKGVKQFSLTEDVPASHKIRMLYLRLLIWWLRPDIVHIHWAGFATLVKKFWRGPLAITAWGSDIYRIDTMGPGVKEEMIDCLRRAQIVTCDSNDLALAIRTLADLKDERVQIIQWGVDLNSFFPVSESSELVRELNLQGRPVILSPRNFTPLYNQETVVHAFRRVIDEIPSAFLLMKNYGGDEDYLKKIQGLIKDLDLDDRVHIYPGTYYHRMPDYYRSGQVMLSLPETDATPMTMLEGMACGCIPIMSDLPSVREWVRNDWNGYLVPYSDADAVARAIVRVLKDQETAKIYRERNFELVKQKADQKVNMEKIERIYESLLDSIDTSSASFQRRGEL